MDELSSLLGAETAPVEFADILPTELPALPIPKGAIRNRAATLSMMASSPDRMSQDYQLMLSEGENGSDSFTKSLEKQVKAKSSEQDGKTFMSILSDASIPMDEKRRLIDDIKVNPALKDTRTTLYTNSLSQPSKDETPEAEDARVGLAGRALDEVYADNIAQQGLVNSFVANLDGADTVGGYAARMGEAGALWFAPFGYSVSATRLHKALNEETGFWGMLKSMALPGSRLLEMREDVKNLPIKEKMAFRQQFLDKLKTSSGVVFGADNQFSQAEKAQQIFEEGGYSSEQAAMDNIGALMDIFGLGFIARGLKPAAKTVKAASKLPTPQVVAKTAGAPPVGPAKGVVQESDLASVTGKPTTGAYDSKIKELESQKASLLGETSGQLDTGVVTSLKKERIAAEKSFTDFGTKADIAKDIQKREGITAKEAKEKADVLFNERQADHAATVKRIDDELSKNASASSVTQRVADIEKNIEMLKQRNTPIFLRQTPLAEAISRIERNSLVRIEHPTSVHATLKQTNPEKARATHEMIVKSQGDMVAEGLTGVNKQQAIANDVFPQVLTAEGRVVAQPVDIQRNLRRKELVPEDITKLIWSSGRVDLSPAEKAAVKAQVVKDYRSASGMTMHETMGGFDIEGGRIKISATYGTPEGAFVDANEAVAQAKLSLRNMGILDDEIQVLKRDGSDYVPVSLADAQTPGDYLVRVNTFHEIDPTDVTAALEKEGKNWDDLDVKMNWFDRMPGITSGDSGTLQQHLVDHSSSIHTRLTTAASEATDKGAQLEKLMLEEVAKVSDKFTKLTKAQQKQLDSYWREANFNGLALDITDLTMVRKMSNEQVAAAEAWRKYWDMNHYLESLDASRTLKAENYQLFKNNNAELIAKPVAKNSSLNTVYDPDLDQVVHISPKEMDDLYGVGGTVAKLKRPASFHGKQAEYMVSRNTPTSYLRKIRDTDPVLNYKEGYYSIRYKAPRFVDETSADGITRAVAVAGDSLEAERFAARMNKQAANGETYTTRGDARAMKTGSDDWFDIEGGRGRIAQRHRGKLLEDGAGMNHLGEGDYIMDPVSSAVLAARSISGRTISRPVIESMKERFIKLYGKSLKGDGMGGKLFPSKRSDIGQKGKDTDWEVADARTMYGFIRYQENGYINGVDNFYKGLMHNFAEMVGRSSIKHDSRSLAAVERGLLGAANLGPTQLGKHLSFTSLIANSPLRQLVVQAHQTVRTMFYNPEGWFTGRIPELISGYTAHHAGSTAQFGRLKKGDAADFADFIDSSGVMAAVDKHNLVRGSLVEAANNSNKIISTGAKFLNLPRQLGFNQGEKLNQLGHMATVYDKYKAAGKNLKDPEVRSFALKEARALGYEMNAAGDMPYNQNSMGLFMQFMQIPHKAWLQYTNRSLDKSMRIRLLAADTAFWGTAGGAATYFFNDILPDDKELREAITDGIESVAFNKMLRTATGDKSINVDISSLAPADMQGFADLFLAYQEGGIEAMWLNSPTGQLLKSDGKIQTAIKSLSRWAGFTERIEEKPEEFTQVINNTLSIYSGYSAGMKAYLALKTGERYSKYGQLIDKDTHSVEAVMEAFGFTDKSTKQMYEASVKASKAVKDHEEEIKQDVKNVLQYITSNIEGKDSREVEMMRRTSEFALSRYKNDPLAKEIFTQQLMFRLRDPKSGLITSFMKASQLPDNEKLMDRIRMAPLPDEQKKQLLDMFKYVNENRESK